jgi:hypothetical protein
VERYCVTRMLKNASFLRSPAIGFLPRLEPREGFQSLIPPRILRNLDKIPPEKVGIERLAKALAKNRPPRAGAKVVEPLFSGTLRFVRTTFSSDRTDYSVPDSDTKIALQYAGITAVPISEYASQYGANALAVATKLIPFKASLTGGRYNDSMLSQWVDELAKAQGFGADSCLAFLNPSGVVNTDADITQGIGGYHNISSSGVPYIFVNVQGQGLTLADHQDVYASALSHEMAEMTVDPRADGRNPEVCDPCAGNCGTDHRDYFDSNGTWLGGSAVPGYYFFIDGIATPATVVQCPAPAASCSYPPPKTGGTAGGAKG